MLDLEPPKKTPIDEGQCEIQKNREYARLTAPHRDMERRAVGEDEESPDLRVDQKQRDIFVEPDHHELAGTKMMVMTQREGQETLDKTP